MWSLNMIGAAISVACANGITMLVVAGSIEQTMQAIIGLIGEEKHDSSARSTGRTFSQVVEHAVEASPAG